MKRMGNLYENIYKLKNIMQAFRWLFISSFKRVFTVLFEGNKCFFEE